MTDPGKRVVSASEEEQRQETEEDADWPDRLAHTFSSNLFDDDVPLAHGAQIEHGGEEIVIPGTGGLRVPAVSSDLVEEILMQMLYTDDERLVTGEETERPEEPQEDRHDEVGEEQGGGGGREGGGGTPGAPVQPVVQLRRGRRSSSSGRLVTVRSK